MIDYREIRNNSISVVKKLHYPVSEKLPLLEDSSLLGYEAISTRALALYTVVAVSYGFSSDKSFEWIKQEGLENDLTERESDFVCLGIGDKSQFKEQVEALNVFAWAFQFHESLDFSSLCPNDLISYFPDIKNLEGSRRFIENIEIRDKQEIIEACDLAYCLHWGYSELMLNGKVREGLVPAYVVIERRRALEWMLGKENWDDVTLDT